MRYLKSVRMAFIKKTDVSEDVEKSKPLCTDGGNVNWYSRYEKQYGGFSKN